MSHQTNVEAMKERAMEAYESAKKRGWSGVSDERLMEMPAGSCKTYEEQRRPSDYEWVGLTLDELLELSQPFDGILPEGWMKLASVIESKLKAKNERKEKNTIIHNYPEKDN